MRFGTTFFSNQLVDLFAYELPMFLTKFNSDVFDNTEFIGNLPLDSEESNSESFNTIIKKNSNSILVYNFHNLMFNNRFFVFVVGSMSVSCNFTINSISELYPNAGWLERELSELHGLLFMNKKDTRNLMLQYGDLSAPLRKSSPSIGLRELFYDALLDKVISTSNTLAV